MSDPNLFGNQFLHEKLISQSAFKDVI